MAIYISIPQSPMSFLMIILFFLMLSHNVNSTSFGFSSFGSSTNDITFQGDASASNGALQLTKLDQYGDPLPHSAGRASYAAPVRLWNSKTGDLAGFTTTFSFVVAPTIPGHYYGDGISFFIAPFKSDIPKNSSGGFLGLFSADSALNSYQNQIVAVEFDSFGNPWDPVSSHIGIDINSIASATTAPWGSGNLGNPLTALATVNYEPVSKNLSVIVSYPQSQGNVDVSSSSVWFAVDLRIVLPEWVRIGFSGATGQLVEVHKILSWDFGSSFN